MSSEAASAFLSLREDTLFRNRVFGKRHQEGTTSTRTRHRCIILPRGWVECGVPPGSALGTIALTRAARHSVSVSVCLPTVDSTLLGSCSSLSPSSGCCGASPLCWPSDQTPRGLSKPWTLPSPCFSCSTCSTTFVRSHTPHALARTTPLQPRCPLTNASHANGDATPRTCL